jgi:D-amino-acid dehydrogenase
MRAVVIGGGIVGLSCGYFLAREGVDVTVVDRARFGSGASYGNAGFVSPSLVAPIPGPGAIKLDLRSMYRPGAAIALRPTASPARLLWLAAFAGQCTARRQRRGLHATARFAQRAIPAYDLLARDGIEFTMQRRVTAVRLPQRTERVGVRRGTDGDPRLRITGP